MSKAGVGDLDIKISPVKIEANIAPKEEVTLTFSLKYGGANIEYAKACMVSLGVSALPPGANIFLHQTRVSLPVGKRIGISFTVELEPHMASRQVLDVTPTLKRSSNGYKCILATRFKKKDDDASLAGKPGSQYINVFVRALVHDTEHSFTLKKSTKFGRLKQVYQERAGIPEVTRIRFIFDGFRLEDDMTPEDYNMANNEVIEMMECICGC